MSFDIVINVIDSVAVFMVTFLLFYAVSFDVNLSFIAGALGIVVMTIVNTYEENTRKI